MKPIDPPQFPFRMLKWFCPDNLYESIEGDLLEKFDEDVELVGLSKAKRNLFWNSINFFRPGIILRNTFTLHLINTIMIGNYIKVASRNILKRKMYSFINAFGLSVGIAFCVLIFLFIEDEKSFDQFHANKNLIYRLEEKSYDSWQHLNPKDPYLRSAYLMKPLMQAVKDELPEVTYATRYNSGGYAAVKYGDKIFSEKNITFVDADFFKMFSFRMIAGNPDKIFKSKLEAAITPAIAQKYFGEESPLGKTLHIDLEGEKDFIVTAIVEAPPANSSLNFDILLPQENTAYYQNHLNQWGNFNTPTFVQLVPGANLVTFKSNLDKLLQKHMGDKLEKWRKEAVTPVPADVKLLELEFSQLPEWHLKKEIGWDKVSDPQYSMILGGIALLILIIASINYVSLALTTSASRKTEVGIRKVAGAQKKQLVWQFTIESVVLALLSMCIGIGLVFMFLNPFNEFTGKSISISFANVAPMLLVSFVLTVFIGLLAGSYPALFLSGFNPSSVLKGTFTSKVNAGFTKPLVVVQFALSAFLIMSSLIMYRQMKFVTTKDLGYNQAQILVVPAQAGFGPESNTLVERFRNRLQQEPSVMSVAGTGISFAQGYSRYGYKINGEQKAAYVYPVDAYYLTTLEARLEQGRNFDARIAADSNAIIVNEALVRDMKWKEPLNEYLNYNEDSVGRGAKVIGVVKDYHFLSLEKNIEPMFLSMNKNLGYLTTMLVKVTPGDIPTKVEKLRGVWKELQPDKPFEYSFLDEDVARQYMVYQRWMNIMQLSTGFAILISCLGLFGLSGINALNRTKEMGIRKVMGANVHTIFILLNRPFVWLALIAFVVAAPISWFVMNRWLKDFQYKITIGWELFAASMLIGALVALLTVSYHAFKTAWLNPAETLKNE
ncbi:MAG: ABC transporter permease [Bacteroidetes bacterium]|nr:ABC transporter permease [Bacteroidota bacterium]